MLDVGLAEVGFGDVVIDPPPDGCRLGLGQERQFGEAEPTELREPWRIRRGR